MFFALSIYFQWPDSEIRFSSVRIVKYLCKIAWPRIAYNSQELLKGIAIAYDDVFNSSSTNDLLSQLQDLIDLISICSNNSEKQKEIIQVSKINKIFICH